MMKSCRSVNVICMSKYNQTKIRFFPILHKRFGENVFLHAPFRRKSRRPMGALPTLCSGKRSRCTDAGRSCLPVPCRSPVSPDGCCPFLNPPEPLLLRFDFSMPAVHPAGIVFRLLKMDVGNLDFTKIISYICTNVCAGCRCRRVHLFSEKRSRCPRLRKRRGSVAHGIDPQREPDRGTDQNFKTEPI